MKILKESRGIALVIVIMIMVLLLSITGAAILFSGLNLKAANNLKTGNIALHIADAGIQHALAIIPSGSNFNTLLAGSIPGFALANGKPTLVGSLSGYTYTVVAENDPNDPGGLTNDTDKFIVLTSTAIGLNSTVRKVKAYLGRSDLWIPPAALYIPGPPQNILTRFDGNSFIISGDDTNPGQPLGSGPLSSVPGIATTTSGTTSKIREALSAGQSNRITGQGEAPSIMTSLTTIDVNDLAVVLLAVGMEGVDKQTLSGGSYSSGEWGTEASPKITHITGDATLTGTLTGYGVLIMEGNLITRGHFTFKGVVIALRQVDFHGLADLDDTGTVVGALLIKESASSDTEYQFGKGAQLYYSSQVVAKVRETWPGPFVNLPKIVRLTAWREMM